MLTSKQLRFHITILSIPIKKSSIVITIVTYNTVSTDKLEKLRLVFFLICGDKGHFSFFFIKEDYKICETSS